MFTTGSKWFFGLSAVSFLLAAAYGWSTGGDELGPITLGYWGGVGDHLGYTLLVSVGLCAALLGLVALATRDANPTALAQLAGTEVAPEAVAPTHPAYWPVVGAFGAALVVLGLVISNVLFIVGFFVLLVVLVEWMVLDWSDRATGDPETNRLVRNRIMQPFEIPIAGFLIVGGGVAAISRMLLTSSEIGAVVVAVIVGVVVLGTGALLATRPRISPNVVAVLLSVLALGVLSAGVVAAARGERTVEQHEPEQEGTPLKPYTPDGTQPNTTTTVAEGAG